MKNLTDLLELIATETKLNEGKILQNQYSINLGTMHFSYKQVHELTNGDVSSLDREIYSFQKIDTPELLQMVYWNVYDKSRTRIAAEENK